MRKYRVEVAVPDTALKTTLESHEWCWKTREAFDNHCALLQREPSFGTPVNPRMSHLEGLILHLKEGSQPVITATVYADSDKPVLRIRSFRLTLVDPLEELASIKGEPS